MKTGYASTLVARSRRQAPLLLPATPSRYETGAQPAQMRDDVTVVEQTDTMPGPWTELDARYSTTVETDRDTDSIPVPGRRPSPTSASHDDFFSAATHSSAIEGADGRHYPRGHRPPLASADDTDAPLMPGVAAAPHGLRAPETGGTPWTVASARATSGPSHPTEHMVAARRSDSQDRSAARAAGAERGNGEPPIVVHIGRLDVRAVSPPPVPRPQPRPRPVTAPTLEERLAARDRH